jgi:hypothetical protein
MCNRFGTRLSPLVNQTYLFDPAPVDRQSRQALGQRTRRYLRARFPYSRVSESMEPTRWVRSDLSGRDARHAPRSRGPGRTRSIALWRKVACSEICSFGRLPRPKSAGDQGDPGVQTSAAWSPPHSNAGLEPVFTLNWRAVDITKLLPRSGSAGYP